MKNAEEVVGKKGAKHVAKVLGEHCDVCRKVLELWIKNAQEFEALKEAKS